MYESVVKREESLILFMNGVENNRVERECVDFYRFIVSVTALIVYYSVMIVIDFDDYAQPGVAFD